MVQFADASPFGVVQPLDKSYRILPALDVLGRTLAVVQTGPSMPRTRETSDRLLIAIEALTDALVADFSRSCDATIQAGQIKGPEPRSVCSCQPR